MFRDRNKCSMRNCFSGNKRIKSGIPASAKSTSEVSRSLCHRAIFVWRVTLSSWENCSARSNIYIGPQSAGSCWISPSAARIEEQPWGSIAFAEHTSLVDSSKANTPSKPRRSLERSRTTRDDWHARLRKAKPKVCRIFMINKSSRGTSCS